MRSAAFRNSQLPVGVRVVIGASLVLGAFAGAQAVTPDSPTAISQTPPPMANATGRQLWRISAYTTVQLVAREPGSPPNSQPYQIEPAALRDILQTVQVVRAGAGKALFGTEELNMLLSPLTEALAHARPDQDIAIVSSGRHDDNTLFGVTAITARLFVVDNRINLIVDDARYDFYDKARGSGLAPTFTVGSRTSTGVSTLQSKQGTNKRSDWLVLSDAPAAPVAQPAPAVAPAAVAPAAAAAPAAVAPAAPVVVPAPAAPSVVTPVAPAAPAAAPSAEQRLTTLKRLFDKGLISKPEYERKKAEILKDL